MTERQLELARHALGLARSRTPYRNHFVAGPGHADYDEWMQMVADGLAVRTCCEDVPFGGDDLFVLTERGIAEAGGAKC